MNQGRDYITAEKRAELEAELHELEGTKRREILRALEYAKSLGDLSENTEYHQAREDQGKLEARIVKIKEILKTSETISSRGGDVVEVGSNVTIRKVGKNEVEKTFLIVGSEEADSSKNKISNHSPFGVALLGKRKNDHVSIKTPSGVVEYEVVKVS